MSKLKVQVKNFLVLAVVALLLITNATAAKRNFLKNGDFEQGNDSNITHWVLRSKTGEVKISADTVSGDKSVHLKATGQRLTFISKKITDLVLDKEYTLSFWAKSNKSEVKLLSFFYTWIPKSPHWYRKKKFVVTPKWTKYTFVTKIPPADEWGKRKLEIRFQLKQGEVFIDQVSLESNETIAGQSSSTTIPVVGKKSVPTKLEQGNSTKTVTKKLNNNRQSTTAVNSRKNILDNPGFELGWQGWGVSSIGATSDNAGKIEFITSDKVAGKYALKIPPHNFLKSGRYPLKPNKVYTLSFWAKAYSKSGNNGKPFHVIIGPPDYKNMKGIRPFAKGLSSEWKRYSFRYKTIDHGTDYRNTVSILLRSGNNSVLVDSIQFEEGELSDYDSGIQIGFQLPEDNKYAIFREDKPSYVDILLYAQNSKYHNLTLKIKGNDIYGKTIFQQTIPIKTINSKKAAYRIDLKNRLAGVINLQAEITNSGNKKILANAIWRYYVSFDDPTQTKVNILFGAEMVSPLNPYWINEIREKIAKIAGSGYDRIQWISSYFRDYNKLDIDDPYLINKNRKNLKLKEAQGRAVMVDVGFHIKSRLDFRWFTEPVPPAVEAREIATYAQKIGNIARELKGVVTYYEILNEPNIHSVRKKDHKYKGRKTVSAERYARIVQASVPQIRQADPTAKICVQINGIDLNYTDKLGQAGGLKDVDVFSFHSYRRSAEEMPIYEDIMKLRKVIDKYNKKIKIFNSEQYYGVRDNRFSASGEDKRDYYSDTEAEQAGKIIQTYLHCIAADNVPMNLFNVPIGLFRFGISNPVAYYYAFGGFRFASQLLYDVKKGQNIKVIDDVRCFLFELKNGEKIVSLNTKKFTTAGFIHRTEIPSAVYDFNGNILKAKELKISYLPTYFKFPNYVAVADIIQAFKNASYYGFSFPLSFNFNVVNEQQINLQVQKSLNQTVKAKINFSKLSKTVKLKPQLAIQLGKNNTTSNYKAIGSLSQPLAFDKSYYFTYTAFSGDIMTKKFVKLPSMFIKSTSPIQIDANGSEWKDKKVYRLTENNLSKDFSKGKLKHSNQGDLSAKFSMAWDKENLYFYISVKDNKFVPGDGKGKYYKYDSLQIYFDLLNNPKKNKRMYNKDDVIYQIGFNPQGKAIAYVDRIASGRYVGAFNAVVGIDDAVKVVAKYSNKTITYEIAFPHYTIPFLKLQKGSCFAFALLINDNDKYGRKQGITTTPKNSEPYKAPTTWTTVGLR
jgi:hypothetical protein